ncbi:hypothetical protein P5673_028102, partial [Acropora cervicornis]
MTWNTSALAGYVKNSKYPPDRRRTRVMTVKKKISILLYIAFKRASKSGGKALKKLVNGWKFAPNYKLKVFYNEVDVLELKDLRSAGRARQHQVRVKKRWKEQCHTTLSFLGLYNYVATKVEVFNEDT